MLKWNKAYLWPIFGVRLIQISDLQEGHLSITVIFLYCLLSFFFSLTSSSALLTCKLLVTLGVGYSDEPFAGREQVLKVLFVFHRHAGPSSDPSCVVRGLGRALVSKIDGMICLG